MSDLGLYISAQRAKKKLSTRKLAKLASLSHTEIYRIENGERKNPSPPVLKAISNALGVTYNEIMQVAGYMDSTSPSPVIVARVFDVEDLTEKEIDEVRTFIDFLRNKRK